MESLFLKIISGEIPSEKIYEDEHTVAFLDINPTNPGHTLVIPRALYENIYDIPDDVFCQVMKTVRKVVPAIKKATGADGINIIMNNDPAAGQLIFHAHIHIIPRFESDPFKHWRGTPYKEGVIEIVGEKIRKELKH